MFVKLAREHPVLKQRTKIVKKNHLRIGEKRKYNSQPHYRTVGGSLPKKRPAFSF